MSEQDRVSVIALAGNPNVGKSTLFNQLTGLKQHTGNWPGKTVEVAEGYFTHGGKKYRLVDLPGTYSLMANSEDEEIARDFVCFGGGNVTVIVADATALERSLNLVLQITEITGNAVLCVNLMDEAGKKKIQVDLEKLEALIGIPVTGTTARSKKGISALVGVIEKKLESINSAGIFTVYPEVVEKAIARVEKVIKKEYGVSRRWLALKLLEKNKKLTERIECCLGVNLKNEQLQEALKEAEALLEAEGIDSLTLTDICVAETVRRAEKISGEVVSAKFDRYKFLDRRIDKLLTSKYTGVPLMLLMLCGIFWITITGANYPSMYLSKLLFGLEPLLYRLTQPLPAFARGVLVTGMYHTLAWVVSVMLPPMAIFFPLFAIMEDSGYLPRIAFNLDKCFKCAHAHGRQALTMCQGFGCNACGVMGCRIINSPRERLIAILTNNFVPCNGRFPTIILLITVFFSAGNQLVSSAVLLAVITAGVLMTLAISKLLSVTLLKGQPSSFALELPAYRRPQFGKVIVRSFLDRTLFVLSRAVLVAVPAGAVIWLLANLHINGVSLLVMCGGFLDPLGRAMGMDGYILLAFLLGFPANEIVLPILIMCYTASGSMMDFESTSALAELLKANGWTWVTALCTITFSLMHFPCATTCQTIYKETKSLRWTFLAVILPTVVGMAVCMGVTLVTKLLRLS